MPKSDKKKSSGPPYKLPKDRYLVVTSPWTRNKEGIAAWFAIMLKEQYFGETVTAIYAQKDSDDNMIIQLPRKVEDISYFLGAHFHSAFLMDRPHDDRVSYVYQYDWANHNDPAIKFHEYFPNNAPIPNPQFPHIRDPYPLPVIGLAPPPFVAYACRISSATKERVVARMAAALPPPQTNAPQSSTSQKTLDDNSQTNAVSNSLIARKLLDLEDKKPLQNVATTIDPRLAYRARHLQEQNKSCSDAGPVKKIDPYEEAERAEQLLRSLSPVKKDEANEFLGSLFPSVKEETMPPTIPQDEDTTEPHVPGAEGEYKPSAELLAAFSMLAPDSAESPQPQVKPEPVDAEIPEYQPSAELLASFAMLSPEMVNPSDERIPVEEREDVRVRVKTEPREDHSYALSQTELPTSMKSFNRNTDINQGHQRHASASIQIKSEPEEPYIGLHATRAYPQHGQAAPTRDPRLRQQYTSVPAVSSKREGDHIGRGNTPTKRIKAEPQD